MSATKHKPTGSQKLGISPKLTFPGLIAAVRRAGIRTIPVFGQIFTNIGKTAVKKRKLLLLLIPLISIAISAKIFHTRYFGPNVAKTFTLFIRDKDNFEKVVQLLKENGCLTKVKTFEQLAAFKNYDTHVKPGAYKLQKGWSNNQLINILRSGAQTPVKITFNNVRTFEDLAGKLSRQLQCDSITFLLHFKNDSNILKLGYKQETLPVIFIPNTYSVYWTTTPSAFLSRMKLEHDQFWTESRKQKARNAGLSSLEVATLASIVQEESNKNDEKPIIAGVYLNRLRKNWPLQADPTIRFALGDFTIRRILTAQLSVESPYNTYLKTGLPPGPINFPEISSLEAVLNYKVHDFFYFCAKEDFSGYHNFAKTLSEHNRNARKYQEALNRMKVYK